MNKTRRSNDNDIVIETKVTIIPAPQGMFAARPKSDSDGVVCGIFLSQIIAIEAISDLYKSGEAITITKFIDVDELDFCSETAILDSKGNYSIPCDVGPLSDHQLIQLWNSRRKEEAEEKARKDA